MQYIELLLGTVKEELNPRFYFETVEEMSPHISFFIEQGFEVKIGAASPGEG